MPTIPISARAMASSAAAARPPLDVIAAIAPSLERQQQRQQQRQLLPPPPPPAMINIVEMFTSSIRNPYIQVRTTTGRLATGLMKAIADAWGMLRSLLTGNGWPKQQQQASIRTRSAESDSSSAGETPAIRVRETPSSLHLASVPVCDAERRSCAAREHAQMVLAQRKAAAAAAKEAASSPPEPATACDADDSSSPAESAAFDTESSSKAPSEASSRTASLSEDSMLSIDAPRKPKGGKGHGGSKTKSKSKGKKGGKGRGKR
ncbi:hypothetical protein JKP88DRAFT_268302 [Tribonema minus]|uniref:Uncharacterized protein n=1 Tax=Tribonema minus TaxID=303371 RepID=A0A835ZAU4_9STRA|nr:hypothetical protein JKP88DRAFT_268302 [Tribonema minus]